jgi:CRP-like cAMP-binding protein
MEKLRQALAFGGILSEEFIQLALQYFTPRQLKPNHHFLETGEISDEIAFVSEGILRVYALDKDGTEVTKYFVRPNQFAVNLESYYSLLPSDTSMQAVVETHLAVIRKSVLEKISAEIPNFYIFTKTLTEANLLNKIKDNDFLNFGTAKEKYLEFTRRYPDLARQVPQQHIASYLKITPQSLSRIRKELSRTK